MSHSSHIIDLDWINFEAYDSLRAYDEKNIGTKKYLGLAYFWGDNPMSRVLRDATPKQRKRVHDQWLEKRLNMTSDSAAHAKIVRTVMASGGGKKKTEVANGI
jgi:hypothetical protein